MNKSTIIPSLFDQMLSSAPNAARKGQAQYFTPASWAGRLALGLPRHRRTIVDLTCGAGHLLRAARQTTTFHTLGCDIDPSQLTSAQLAADLTLFAPLLEDVKFRADLFVLNPPWDLHWHRDRLAFLADTRSPSVAAAFAAHDGRTPRGTIDSSVATLCIALALCSPYGEGYLIMNQSTARRLILEDGAPHVDLRDHVWGVLDLPENTAAPVPSTVLYFARDHLSGPQLTRKVYADAADQPPDSSLITFNDRRHRFGAEVNEWSYTSNQDKLWEGAAEEFRRVHPSPHSASSAVPNYNLWLKPDGHIGAHVSLYDEKTGRVPVEDAALLHSLGGKRPLQLVVQRAQRDALTRACREDSPWRVDPALREAVAAAVLQYNAARAPLYPLPPIQRLGYLDEENFIECKSDLSALNPPLSTSQPLFLAGRRYPITTQTLAVRRPSIKVNLTGEDQQLELTGQELAIFITGEDGAAHCFMEARLLDEKVTVERPGETRPTARNGEPVKKDQLPSGQFAPAREVIHFTLPQLVDSFVVPEVPDVATLQPDAYQRNLRLLEHIESLCP